MTLDWNTPIQAAEEREKAILESGVYPAICTKFEKEYNQKHDCPQASLTWSVPYNGRFIEVRDWILLKDSWAWKIHQVFRSTGQARREDETIKPAWDYLLFAGAMLHIVQRDFQGREGGVVITNAVKSYLPHEDMTNAVVRDMPRWQKELKSKTQLPPPGALPAQPAPSDDSDLPF